MYCWVKIREGERVECDKAECCYHASEQAVFAYWKFANSDRWKKMLQEELERQAKEAEG